MSSCGKPDVPQAGRFAPIPRRRGLLSGRIESRNVTTTLVICIDRSGAIGRATNVPMPVAGWEAVRSLVTDAGLSDPEDASVNCLLESLRVARDLRDEREEAVVAVVSAESDTAVGADRSIAAQLDDLVDRYDPRAAIVVVDSAEDEQVLPIVESRIPVDSCRPGGGSTGPRYRVDLLPAQAVPRRRAAPVDDSRSVRRRAPVGARAVLLVLRRRGDRGRRRTARAALLYKGLAIDRFVAGCPNGSARRCTPVRCRW